MKIAILGAECTGKSTLAKALSLQLQAEFPRVVWVPEYLREWCDAQGRTPNSPEQAHIAQTQMARVQAHGRDVVVISDTTPLMTAVYSDVVLGDASRYAQATQQQRSFGLTLVTATDLPWVADGLQRDGLALRAKVNQRLREVLVEYGIGFSMVYGTGEARTQSALQVIRYALGAPRPSSARSHWKWPCEKCSDAECEHRLFSAMLGRAS
jgi:HTH-type transcriptional repressor of NAD biosynthesis genes